ncbi:hypothetical protein H744_1c0658 [Photobacterium gaetbulicola Gung47]|uniref:Uncharacterized protein TP-0789 domain-containing protein n=1 Tax=Photobacterium gaetbulicola Gung47 TaxID=658445 RepID=A0A0C5WEW7_9GAMM|nr:outer membrane lipoprotein-sorting protein [Photobacterium gaetbulicola]AJR05683.1 hypothetical protein H744_1c0658 [Photobacterium gaetbulicola Gung47]
MRINIVKAFITATIAMLSLNAANAAVTKVEGLTGQQIAEKVAAMEDGYVGESRKLKFLIYDANNNETVREMEYFAKQYENRFDRSIVKFTYPAQLNGVRLLTHSKGADDDDQWLFLPSIKKVKRIATSNKSGAFMGSELAYEDISIRQLEKYQRILLGSEIIDGVESYVIERTPIKANSGYSKQIIWRDQTNLLEIKTEFYDRKGDLLKVRKSMDWKKFGKYWRAQTVEVFNVQTNKRTVMELSEIKLFEDFDNVNFTPRRFQRF